jgi:protein ImuB
MNERETWLAVQLPHLALDLYCRGVPAQRELPLAVSDGDARRPCIRDCNPAAARQGIRAGLPLSAALALAEGLHVAPPDATAERQALERLAAWAYQYSSRVSLLHETATLLLEVGASRRLFGEPAALSRRLADELLRLGFHADTGTAPTPEAARIAARHGCMLDPPPDFQRQLGSLPLEQLCLDARQHSALHGMGLRTLGELLRLPRKALARRLGPGLLDYLDRLCGRLPDPRQAWQPAAQFSAQLELPAESASHQALLFPLRRLLAELCGVLRAGDFGLQEFEVQLQLRRGEECFRIGLQQPCRDEDRFMLLLRERLERLRLAAPVRQVRLLAGNFQPFAAGQDGLFPDSAGSPDAGPLLERLQARLGERAVNGLRGVADHRPEHSWATRRLQERPDCHAMPHRPVWLLGQPQPCRIEDFQVLAGPERIETGWWDGRDCRRDYFVVRDAGGSTLWAYREYKPQPGWYLHGVFG